MLLVFTIDVGTGKTDIVPLSETDSVMYLKRKISFMQNCPFSDIDIVFGGSSLPDDSVHSTKSACGELIVYWVDKRRANEIVL